jgi:small subunit ribosomal protein S2
MAAITLSELLDAGVHFGHQASRWNPKMFPYIYAEQNGIHVIDLIQTSRLLTYAHDYVSRNSQENKTFLFIGTKRQATNIIAEEAKKMWCILRQSSLVRWYVNKLENCSNTCYIS